jgi:hypothetical protein
LQKVNNLKAKLKRFKKSKEIRNAVGNVKETLHF